MIKIIPSILTNDKSELTEMIKVSEEAVDRVHVDIIDGIFVDNKTPSPTALYKVKPKLKVDYHLMVNLPEQWIERCVKAHADRIIAHVELMKSQKDYVKSVKSFGVGVGLAIDLNTHISQVDPDVLPELDVILVMSVKAGFGGQSFSPKAILKVKALSQIKKLNNHKYSICVDGGVSQDNLASVYENGADEVAIGRSLFDGDMKENVDKLVSVVKTYKYS